LSDYRKHITKTNISNIEKNSSLVATENYCKWNRSILAFTPFLSGMTACSMHLKTTESPRPPCHNL